MATGEKLPDVSSFLSKKDLELDKFVKGVVKLNVVCGNSNSEAASGGDGQVSNLADNDECLSFEEKEYRYQDNASKFILEESPLTWQRTNNMMQKQVRHKLDTELDDMLAKVPHPKQSALDLVKNYRNLFVTFMSFPKLSFQTGDPGSMGKISPRDYWVLQYFAINTCRRNKGDKCLQLGLVGCTSVGKSTLFEAPLAGTCHQYLGEHGVGRFCIGNKSILFFHDIEVEKHLVSGVDKDIVKTLARGESTKSKVHSSSNLISPVHLFYTSNFRLFDHRVELSPYKRKWNPSLTAGGNQKNTIATHQLQIPLLFGSIGTSASSTSGSTMTATAVQAANRSEVGVTPSHKRQSSCQSAFPPPPPRKKVITLEPANVKITKNNKEHVNAMRARFLECYCPSPPGLDRTMFPLSGTFQRTHMICGIFTYVLDVLERYSCLQDFAYIGLPLYVLCGLAKNVGLYESITGESGGCTRILNLAQKYFPTSQHIDEYNLIFGYLCNNPDITLSGATGAEETAQDIDIKSECDFEAVRESAHHVSDKKSK